jgi:hypothetical protein
VNAALDVLKAQGATLVDPVEIPHMKDYGDQEFTVLLYELKADLNTYLAGLGSASRMKTLADVIAFNDAHKETEMPYFGQETFIQAQEKGPLTDDASRAHAALSRGRRGRRVRGQARRDRGADRRAGVADRSGQWRLLPRVAAPGIAAVAAITVPCPSAIPSVCRWDVLHREAVDRGGSSSFAYYGQARSRGGRPSCLPRTSLER